MIGPGHAKARSAVIVPDGRVGHVFFVSPHEGVARVKIGGRHYKFACADLTPVEHDRALVLFLLDRIAVHPEEVPPGVLADTALAAADLIRAAEVIAHAE